MEKEELLRQRVIVENKWPDCQYQVGDILIKDGDFYWVVGDTSWYGKMAAKDVEVYPYLMRQLHWWEERNKTDMPDYVKEESGIIHKVYYYEQYDSIWMEGFDGTVKSTWCVNNRTMCFFEPASKEEYENYMQPQPHQPKIQ